MALAFQPFKLVARCDRFTGPHTHMIDTESAAESCKQPLFALERESRLLSPSSITTVTLMTEKKKASDSPKSTAPAAAAAAVKAAPVAQKDAPNNSITEKAQDVNGAGAEHRGVASLTWNYAVIFPSALRPHLPFKYTNKTNRVKIQVDIVGDTVVLSKYTPPATKK